MRNRVFQFILTCLCNYTLMFSLIHNENRGISFSNPNIYILVANEDVCISNTDICISDTVICISITDICNSIKLDFTFFFFSHEFRIFWKETCPARKLSLRLTSPKGSSFLPFKHFPPIRRKNLIYHSHLFFHIRVCPL